MSFSDTVILAWNAVEYVTYWQEAMSDSCDWGSSCQAQTDKQAGFLTAPSAGSH